MSWEEVGGSADQEVPIDTHYYKKSGSMSAKIGRNIRTAIRKRSQSRSSVTSSNRTSPPTSPKILAAAIQSFGSRRGSETSVSPSQASVARSFAIGSPSLQQGDFIRRKPSWGSVAASVPGQPESSENSMLLQHQLSADPSPMLHLPRAELNDPRIHSSKLSPFPGIAHLERRVGDGSPLSPPPLLHQASDSVVPPQQHVTPASDSIYAIPLKATSLVESRCGSDDSTGKRNWLAKVFGQQTSPRTSVSVARRSSNQDIFGDVGRVGRKPSTDGHPSFALPTPETDPFAGPPLPGTKPTRHRSASPSVSTVPEVSDEGSRLTRFTAATQRVDNSSPLVEEDESEESGQPLPQKSVDMLNRMDNLLALALDDPARPDILDDPPRKLLLATQVLQVVNVNVCFFTDRGGDRSPRLDRDGSLPLPFQRHPSHRKADHLYRFHSDPRHEVHSQVHCEPGPAAY